MLKDDVLGWAAKGPVSKPVAELAEASGVPFAEAALAVDALVATGELEWCNDGKSCALTPLSASRLGLHIRAGKWTTEPDSKRPCRFSGARAFDEAIVDTFFLDRPDPSPGPDALAELSEQARLLAMTAPVESRADYGPKIRPASTIVGTSMPWPLPGQDRGPQAPKPGKWDHPKSRPEKPPKDACAACGSLLDPRLRRLAMAVPAGTACLACDATGQDNRIPVLAKAKARSYAKEPAKASPASRRGNGAKRSA